MIRFASPLADKATAEAILDAATALHDRKALVSGIKACQKFILTSPEGAVLVLSATTSPADLITHLPILCEKHHVGYIFVKDNSWMKGFTCIVLHSNDDAVSIGPILAAARTG